MMWLLAQLFGAFNVNGRGIWRCSCCGCSDGCDHHCWAMERACRIHGYVFPWAKVMGWKGKQA